MELIDIGANLTHESFDPDRDQVIAAAQQAGVCQMMITGASEAGSIAALHLVQQYPQQLFATAGVHPHYAGDYNSNTDSVLRDLIHNPEVKAVGECGLDYFRDLSSRPAQRNAFEKQLEIAAEHQLPVFLHQRDAHHDFLPILRDFHPHLKAAVVHCFTGNDEEMRHYLELDCYIGITGWICDERRGSHLKALVSEIPASRLMVETDAPYLKPRNLRPKIKTHRNEPRWLPWIVGVVAACRGETPAVTAAHTTRNARTFFTLPAVAPLSTQ